MRVAEEHKPLYEVMGPCYHPPRGSQFGIQVISLNQLLTSPVFVTVSRSISASPPLEQIPLTVHPADIVSLQAESSFVPTPSWQFAVDLSHPPNLPAPEHSC